MIINMGQQAVKSVPIDDNSSVSILEKSFSVYLISEEILKHLSLQDLLHLSLVNRFFKTLARSHLRCHKICEIVLKSNTCSQLKELNEMLEKATDAPFTGLHFQKLNSIPDYCKRNCSHWKDTDVTSLYPFIFSKNFRFLSLKIDFQEEQNCLAQEVLREILVRRSSEIEELIISKWPDTIRSLLEYLYSYDFNFPVLSQDFVSFKSLRICAVPPQFPTIIREIVANAPNLQELDSELLGNMVLRPNYPLIPKNKFNIIRSLEISIPEVLDDKYFRKPQLSTSKLTVLLAPELAPPENCFVTKNKSKLQPVVDNFNLIWIRALQEAHLKHLKFLRVEINVTESFQLQLSLFRSIKNSFPNLHKVTLEFVSSKLQPFHNLNTNASNPAGALQYLSVQELTVNILNCFKSVEERIKLWLELADIFPNIKRLDVREPQDYRVASSVLWNQCTPSSWRQNLQTIGFYCPMDTFQLGFKLFSLFSEICFYELDELHLLDFQKWQFSASRVPFFQRISWIPNICIVGEHSQRCTAGFNMCPDFLKNLKVIVGMMKAKMPKFVLQVEMLGCPSDCYPLALKCISQDVDIQLTNTSRGKTLWTIQF